MNDFEPVATGFDYDSIAAAEVRDELKRLAERARTLYRRTAVELGTILIAAKKLVPYRNIRDLGRDGTIYRGTFCPAVYAGGRVLLRQTRHIVAFATQRTLPADRSIGTSRCGRNRSGRRAGCRSRHATGRRRDQGPACRGDTSTAANQAAQVKAQARQDVPACRAGHARCAKGGGKRDGRAGHAAASRARRCRGVHRCCPNNRGSHGSVLHAARAAGIRA